MFPRHESTFQSNMKAGINKELLNVSPQLFDAITAKNRLDIKS